MIDRKFTHYIINSAFDKKLFAGTLFDGEIIRTATGFEFQIFDCLAFAGQYIGDEPHDVRLQVFTPHGHPL
jgi:hypothetical protein